jgi:hypothetical protein
METAPSPSNGEDMAVTGRMTTTASQQCADITVAGIFEEQ